MGTGDGCWVHGAPLSLPLPPAWSRPPSSPRSWPSPCARWPAPIREWAISKSRPS